MPTQFPSLEVLTPHTTCYPTGSNITTINYYHSIQPQVTPSTPLPSIRNMPQLQSRTPIAVSHHPYSNVLSAPALKKSCKGCGDYLCKGKMRRSECKNPNCLSCRSSVCEGIWDKKECQNPTSVK
ncbi:hypothetical protein BD770DRAFT_73425 [Pilaira anomala]|nr:hypothetical protein BD770DRAFT_73425 [Pilaira anomala]